MNQLSNKLRVAYLFQGSSTDFSEPFAVQLHILHTLRGLQARGHQVSLLALQEHAKVLFSEDLDAIVDRNRKEKHYCDIGWSGNSYFRLFERGARRIQVQAKLPYLALFDDFRIYEAGKNNLYGFDLIHERYNFAALGGALASRKLNIPYVLEINADGLDQIQLQGRSLRNLQRQKAIYQMRFCLDAAEKIICVSSELREHLIKEWNIRSEKTVVLPCAADIDLFNREHNTKEIRRILGLHDEPVIMWIGGFYPWHDLEFLVTSFTQILIKIPDARLILVGDGRTREAVAKMVHDAGLENSVIMLGKVPHEKIPEMLSIAEVVVSASSYFPGYGGTPLKLFEYMAAGKAIVSVGMSQASAVIENNFNGILTPPGNEREFINAIIQLLQDKEKRNDLGRNARQRAIEKHSWKKYAELLEGIYYDTLVNREKS